MIKDALRYSLVVAFFSLLGTLLFVVLESHSKARPVVENIRTLPDLPNPTGTWVANATDSTLTNSWKLVNAYPLTRMTAADTLRVYSSSAADSTFVYILGIGSADSQRVFSRVQVRGTDTTTIAIRHRHYEAIYTDTTHAGTISVKAKTGTSTVATIPAGALQSYTAHHFQGQKEGRLTQIEAQVSPESPAVELQVRLYRHQANAVSAPEVGYSVLRSFTLGGEMVYLPNVAEVVLAGNNDTSAVFSVVGAERVGYFNSTRSVGTAVTAFYIDVSPNQSTWKQTNGVDSVTGANSTKIRARVIPPDSLYGLPWARFIVDNQGVTGDSAIVSSFLTIRRGNRAGEVYVSPLNEHLPAHSYVAVYARSMGASAGRVYVMLKGEDK